VLKIGVAIPHAPPKLPSFNPFGNCGRVSVDGGMFVAGGILPVPFAPLPVPVVLVDPLEPVEPLEPVDPVEPLELEPVVVVVVPDAAQLR
jgi:hypothetical protein